MLCVQERVGSFNYLHCHRDGIVNADGQKPAAGGIFLRFLTVTGRFITRFDRRKHVFSSVSNASDAKILPKSASDAKILPTLRFEEFQKIRLFCLPTLKFCQKVLPTLIPGDTPPPRGGMG